MNTQVYPSLKNLIRLIYTFTISLLVISSSVLFKRQRKGVFYGGARAGSLGGARVKVQRLKSYFPEAYLGFSTIYSLSNCPYMNSASIRTAKKQKTPIIHNQNGVFYPSWFQGDWKTENEKISAVYLQADYVFWQSNFCKVCADKFLGKRSGPGEVLYNAVDTNVFVPSRNRKLDDHFTFLINGKIDLHLGYRVLLPLEAIMQLISEGIKCKLLIAGFLDPKVKQRAEHMIAERNMDQFVSFLGAYSQQQAPLIYQQADASIMIKQNDPCPNTVIEAMSCGLPIVYSNTGGLPEMVGVNCGFPVPCEENFFKFCVPEQEALSAALKEATNKGNDKKANARARAVDVFNIENWIERHNIVFKEYGRWQS